MTSMYFEDFRVGQRFSSGGRLVTEQDLKDFTELSGDRHARHTTDEPVLHAAFGQAVVAGLFHEMGLVDDTGLGALDTHWNYRAPLHPGDTLHFEMTITRCERAAGEENGVVNRHVTLLNQHDGVVQEGTVAMRVRARGHGPDPAARAFGTVAWARAIADLAGTDERFTSATASWDGTVGLRCGPRESHLRVYRGQVIDVARRTPHGASFTVGADEIVWTELLTGPRNDFVRATMQGRFDVTGDGYEYLRLTKVVHLLVEHARTLAQQGAPE